MESYFVLTWIILMVLRVVHSDAENERSFYTPDEYYYKDTGLYLDVQSSLVLSAQTCNDAHIALSTNYQDFNQLTYEIVIGGWANTRSVIRRCRQCKHEDEKYTPFIVDCQTPKYFWISWSSDVLKVGRGTHVGKKQFMQFHDPQPYAIRYAGLSTGWGSIGSWTVQGASAFGAQPTHTIKPPHHQQDGWMHFTTPNLYEYRDVGYDLSHTKSIVFKVQACNDAHIALSERLEYYQSRTYEVVLSGWSNTQSVIRKCKQCAHMNEVHTPFLISCDEMKSFWISWRMAQIQVGKGSVVGTDVFMTFSDPHPFNINYAAISTGWGSQGEWLFPVMDLSTEEGSSVEDSEEESHEGSPDHQGLQGESQGHAMDRLKSCLYSPYVVDVLKNASQDNTWVISGASNYQQGGVLLLTYLSCLFIAFKMLLQF